MLPPPTLSAPPSAVQGSGGGCQVRCAGCRMILSVGAGLTEFVCPTCQMPQMLPPELLRVQAQQQRSVPAHGIDPTKIQLPCANCKAILNVPHGLARFNCPQCGVDLAVDHSKIIQFFPQPLPPLLPPPPEEVNEVAIEVEREEDEGGIVGETFTDYRPLKLSIGPSHPDPIVETSSLSAVQPPEPTYDLMIKDDLESSEALSCLQIETLVYSSQRHLQHLPNGSRAGFFVGDGAGVGKGRTIAGLIWENWHLGRRKALILRNNNISGSIPSNIGDFRSLLQLDLSFNNLIGQIPDLLFNLNSLSYLFLGNNRLTGVLPSQKSASLQNIDLSYNELSGSIPSWVGERNLQLNLVANNFTTDRRNSR